MFFERQADSSGCGYASCNNYLGMHFISREKNKKQVEYLKNNPREIAVIKRLIAEFVKSPICTPHTRSLIKSRAIYDLDSYFASVNEPDIGLNVMLFICSFMEVQHGDKRYIYFCGMNVTNATDFWNNIKDKTSKFITDNYDRTQGGSYAHATCGKKIKHAGIEEWYLFDPLYSSPTRLPIMSGLHTAIAYPTSHKQKHII